MRRREREEEQNEISALGEMRTTILAEVSTLEGTMQKLYDRFVTVHKLVVLVQRVCSNYQEHTCFHCPCTRVDNAV